MYSPLRLLELTFNSIVPNKSKTGADYFEMEVVP